MRTLVGADEPEPRVNMYPVTHVSVCSSAGGLPVWWSNYSTAPVVAWPWPTTTGAGTHLPMLGIVTLNG